MVRVCSSIGGAGIAASLSRKAQSSPGQNSAPASVVNGSDTEAEIADIHFSFLNERIPALAAVTMYPANHLCFSSLLQIQACRIRED